MLLRNSALVHAPQPFQTEGKPVPAKEICSRMKAAGWWLLFMIPCILKKKKIGLPSKTLTEGSRVASN